MKFIKRKRQVLTLNSHSLSYFQRCEKLYEYNTIKKLEPIEQHYPFTKGALISKILELWYRAKKRNYGVKRLELFEDKLFKIITRNKSLKDDDRLLIASRLMQYFTKYKGERFDIVAVEQGFSKVLYEDPYVLFIYEGRPDLIVNFGNGLGLGPVDHKSESMRGNIYMFNNQLTGYCWAIDSKIGMYNFIGLQKDSKNGDVLHRETCTFTNSQIDQWKEDTIKWYHRVLSSMVNDKFIRSWNCESKYGICSMHEICEQPSENTKLIKINKLFKVRENGYRSW